MEDGYYRCEAVERLAVGEYIEAGMGKVLWVNSLLYSLNNLMSNLVLCYTGLSLAYRKEGWSRG